VNAFAWLLCMTVWVGGWSPSKDHCLVNSVTGAIMECFSPPAGNAWGGYGCLVDSVNVLWGSGGYGNYQLFRKAPGQAPTAVGGIPNYVYGLGLDKRTYRRCYRLCTPRQVSVVTTPPPSHMCTVGWQSLCLLMWRAVCPRR
jgi:hypothetical protein